MIQEENQDEIELDIYFQGTNHSLFSFLYPMTGPNGHVFNHLNLQQTYFNPITKLFEMHYQPTSFENIDRQKQNLVYATKTITSQSNYFYSLLLPEQNCLVWKSVDSFVEIRPKNEGADGSEAEKQKKIEIKCVEYLSEENEVRKSMEQVKEGEVRENWEVSEEEYLMYLSK